MFNVCRGAQREEKHVCATPRSQVGKRKQQWCIISHCGELAKAKHEPDLSGKLVMQWGVGVSENIVHMDGILAEGQLA